MEKIKSYLNNKFDGIDNVVDKNRKKQKLMIFFNYIKSQLNE